jgi:hypothetical protein
MLIDRNDLPNHLFGIPDLDLSEDPCSEPPAGPWFRLGACSTGSGGDGQGVENVVYRQSMLLSAEDISVMFDKLESIVGDIGKRAYRLSAMAKRGFIATPVPQI